MLIIIHENKKEIHEGTMMMAAGEGSDMQKKRIASSGCGRWWSILILNILFLVHIHWIDDDARLQFIFCSYAVSSSSNMFRDLFAIRL